MATQFSEHPQRIGLAENTVADTKRRAYANLLANRDAEIARRARAIGDQLGLPGASVEADITGFQHQLDANNNLNLLGTDPHLARFVADEHNAAAVKDDLPPLANTSAIFRLADDKSDGRAFTNYMKRTQPGRRTGLLSAFDIVPSGKDYSFGASEPLFPAGTMPAPVIKPKVGIAEGLKATAESSFIDTLIGGGQALTDNIGAGLTGVASFNNPIAGTVARSLGLENLDLGGAFSGLDYVKRQRQLSADAAKRAQAPMADKGFLAQQAYSALQSVTQLGVALALTGPFAPEAFGAQQFGQSYLQFRDRGASAKEALGGAAVGATAETLFERYFGIGWMLGNLGKKSAGKFLGGLLMREVPSEVATTAVQDLADALTTGGEGWDAYVKQHTALSTDNPLIQTAASTALMVAAIGGPGHIANRLSREAKGVDDVEKAAAGAQFLDQLMQTAEQSKVRKESPDTFRDFVDQRTEDSPVRNVYVPVEDAVAYMQSEGYEGSLDRYSDQIAQAQATNGDIVIPVADAAAYLSGTKAWEALKDSVRIEPGGLSQKEALAKHEEIMSTLEERGKEIAQEAQDADEAKGPAAEVYVEIKNRLRLAGLQEREADNLAQVYAARYEARASRRGGTPMEQFKASKIVFPGEKQGQFEGEGREVAQGDTVVNIGLNVFPELGGGTVNVDEAIKALRDQGVDVTESQIRQSGTEPTLVARLSKPLSKKQATAVSKALRQEAIAQRSPKGGALFGPAAEKWGPFNPDFFLDFDRLGLDARVPDEDVLPEAGWSPERVSGLIDAFGYSDGTSKAYAVMMSPDDFLGLTASAKGRELIEQRVTELPEYGGELDMERLRRSGPPMLVIHLAGEPSAVQQRMGILKLKDQVMGHEGRHRMMLLKQAGVRQVPVVLQVERVKAGDRASQPTPLELNPQRSRSDQVANGDTPFMAGKAIPISWKYKDQLEQMGGRMLFQSPFYSALERAVEASQTKRAPASQWLATLKRAPGVKQEELDWSGIEDWLKMQELGGPWRRPAPVEKEALLGVIRNGGISIDEVVLGRPEAERLAQYGLTSADLEGDNEDAPLIVAEGEPQFQNWSSDPSNQTYRELLITLPVGEAGNPERAPSTHWDQEGVVAHARFMDKKDAEGKRVLFIEEVQSDWHQKGRDQGYAQAIDPEKLKAAREELAARTKIADQIRRDFIAAVDELVRDAKERNQLGLVGFELPSEAAQGDALKRAYAEAVMERIGESADPRLYQDAYHELRALAAAELRESEAEQAVLNTAASGIPNAPFKASWPALVMKRMIAWAAEHGYDKIAWTTGEEQAQRYNLSAATGPIHIYSPPAGVKVDDGYYVNMNAGAKAQLMRNGLAKRQGVAAVTDWVIMSEAQLKEAFGADVAGRLINGVKAINLEEGERLYKQATRDRNDAQDAVLKARKEELDNPTDVRRAKTDALQAELDKQTRIANALRTYHTFTLDGEGLNVGGEGMKAFYDRNLVNITNDLIKKYGVKVGPQIVGSDKQVAALKTTQQAGADRYQQGDERGAEVAFDAANKNADIMRHPGFEINDKMREAALRGFPLFQDSQGPRGSTLFRDDGTKIINLFATANRSTMIHETGHIWLEELKADATADDATEQDKADWETVKKWFASQNFPVGKSGFIPTQAHELWARGIERYFMEGKAPSVKLQGVFKTFKAWLLRIYGVVENLRTPITPEIREVMSRLIATQDAIDEARRNNDTEPLFKSAEEAGMTDAEFADYQQRIADARDEAYDALLYKTMEKIRRERTAEMRDRKAAIRGEVAQKFNGQPQFKLLHLLRTGRWLGDPDREPVKVKLNTGWLLDNFGEDILDKMPKGIQVYAGDGESGDTIAEMVGMHSGAEVVHALVGMRAASDQLRAAGETRSMRDKLIAEETDRVMAERYGDVLTDGSIEEEAITALNSARQGEIIGSELRQLSKRKSVLGTPTPYQFAREWARRTVSSGHVRDVASRSALQRYIRNANKSARAAEEAILKGDIDEAYRQKQAQLLNHALLAEAKAAAERIDKIIARLKKLGGRAAMKSVDPGYMLKIHALLENYDFRERSQKSIDELEQFQQWVEAQRAKGFEVHIPPRLDNNGQPYTRVTVQELESLNDLVQSLLALGRAKQKLRIAQRDRDYAEWRDEAIALLDSLRQRKLSKDIAGEEKRFLAGVTSEFVKIETLAERMDRGATGPFNELLVVGARDAENLRHDLRNRVLKPIADMYHKIGRKHWARLSEKVTIPELTWNTLKETDPRLGDPVTMTRMELLGVFMNMGNLSNLEKLSKGERWPVETLRRVMDRELTKEDYDLAQTMWDQVEGLWPDIVRVEQEMSGIVPEKVVNAPISTRFGEYRGGYWPVVYDSNRWTKVADMEEDAANDMFGLKSGVAVQKGHTITRTEAFGPINFSLEKVLFRHIEQVITRIAYAPFARDVVRVIDSKPIRDRIDTKLGPEFREQIKPWLRAQINEGLTNPDGAKFWDRILRQFRINVTIAAMGFRHTVLLAQSLGLNASADRIGAKWVGVGMKRYAAHPIKSVRFVLGKSKEMLYRNEAVNRETAEMSRRMRGKHTWFTRLQNFALSPIGIADRYTVSVPTWLGAYEKAMKTMDMTDEEAVAFADKAVRMSQGAGTQKDLAAIQARTNEATRFFTMFYSPFNVMFNQQWKGVQAAKAGNPIPLIKTTFYWVIMTALGDAMMHGDWPKDDDDDGVDWGDWGEWFARNVFFGLWSGIPIARDLANWGNQWTGGQYAGDVGVTPVGRIGQTITKNIAAASKWATEGKEPKQPIKQTANLVANVAGVPISQVGTSAQFLWDVHEGRQDPKSVSDWYFGLTKGKVPEPTEAAQ